MKINEDEAALLTNDEAARIIAAKPNVLRISRYTGFLYKGVPTPPFSKMGRAVRYRRVDLTDWIRRQKTYKNNYEAARDAAAREAREAEARAAAARAARSVK